MERSGGGAAEKLEGNGYPAFIMHFGKYYLINVLSMRDFWRAEQKECDQYRLRDTVN